MLLITLSLFFLSGCATRPSFLIKGYAHPNPSPQDFYVCHGYGCYTRTGIKLGSQDWSEIKTLFKTPSATALEERQKISEAITLFETKVGRALGTERDLPKSPILPFYDPTQQDCVDETINTTTYLKILQNESLLKWHRVADPARRGYIVDGFWPHNTAVIMTLDTHEEFTVDSWFYKNGTPPVIIPLKLWRSGWNPDAS